MKKPKYLVTISNLFAIKKNLLTFAEGVFLAVTGEQLNRFADRAIGLFFKSNRAVALYLKAQTAIYLIAHQILICARGGIGLSIFERWNTGFSQKKATTNRCSLWWLGHCSPDRWAVPRPGGWCAGGGAA